MKKILLLGGSAQQVVAIETANKMGYFTILCDYLPDNPGQYSADRFYLASTTDMDLILDIAKKEKIDGVLAYASDPAAPTAAYVAEKLGLPGNPFNSVEILCNKDKFRMFLGEYGFAAIRSFSYENKSVAVHDIPLEGFNLPIIIKPVDSSGSKGATVIYNYDNIENVVDFAFEFSRSGRIIAEEFIEKKHKYLIGGDIFVLDGKIVQWGLMNCHRSEKVNPLVPVGKSYPLELDEEDIDLVKDTLRKLIEYLSIKNGALNVELIIDKNNKVFLIDIGPRSGGNMIPDLLGYIFRCNVVKMSVDVAMGNAINYTEHDCSNHFYATYNLHSAHSGILKNITFSDECLKYMIRKKIYINIGDRVDRFDNASKALGVVFFRFGSRRQMREFLSNIDNHIQIELNNCKVSK